MVPGRKGERRMARRVRPGWFALALCTAMLPAILVGCRGRRLLMPTPNVYASGQVDPFSDVPSPLQSSRIDVLYVTDREPVRGRAGVTGYEHGRSESLAYGSCFVEIGNRLGWEEVTNRSLSRRRLRPLFLSVRDVAEHGRFPATPIHTVRTEEGIIEAPESLAEETAVAERFCREIRARLEKTPCKEALVFIHGYRNRFRDAACTTAELWHFLGHRGIPICYSWPAGSKGLLRGYTYDRESGEFTIFHLKHFLRLLASCPDLEKIQIITHSRGTDVGSSALRELVIEARGAGSDARATLKIGNFVLAAPDLDVSVAQQRLAADRVDQGAERVTTYVSHRDRMIGISSWLFHSARRLGQITIMELLPFGSSSRRRIPGICLIEADVNVDFKGHSYFRTHPAVSSDLMLMIRDNRDPGAENGRPLVEGDRDLDCWKIKNDYPGSPRRSKL